jgi:hypothetical protein
MVASQNKLRMLYHINCGFAVVIYEKYSRSFTSNKYSSSFLGAENLLAYGELVKNSNISRNNNIENTLDWSCTRNKQKVV